MITKIRKYIFGVLFLGAVFPVFVFAVDFNIKSEKIVGLPGEYLVTMSFDTDKSINAIDGKIVFPADLLEIKEIKDGNSVVNFWITKPKLDSSNTISFSGITPGGFNGKDNVVFSVVFKTKKIGQGLVVASSLQALLNDGNGTSVPVEAHNADFEIINGSTGQLSPGVKDTELPESFKPEVSKNPFLFDGKWFVAFATSDKNSGIKSYEIKEARQYFFAFRTEYKKGESPYVLSDQDLHSYIFIKVTDNAGNERVVEVSPRYPLTWYQNSSFWIIIIVLLLFFGIIKKWKIRRIKH